MGTTLPSIQHPHFDLTRELAKTGRKARGSCRKGRLNKTYLGDTVSTYTLSVSFRNYQVYLMELAGRAGDPESAPLKCFAGYHGRGVLASMLWVMQCLLRFALGQGLKASEDAPNGARRSVPETRQHRRLIPRLSQRAGRPVRLRAPALFGILLRGVPYFKRCELLGCLSIRGRLRVYGMRVIGTVLQRLTVITAFDREGWALPATSTLAGGLWEVQLPPD